MRGSLRMLFVLVACVGTIWWLPAPVFASTVEFEFTGRVTGITDQTLLPNLTGGSVFTGRFSFDSSAPDQNPVANYGVYLFGPPFMLTLHVETLTFSQPLSRIDVANDLAGAPGSLLDRVFVRSNGPSADEFGEVSLSQRSTLPMLLSSDALPVSELDLGLVNEFPNFQFFTPGLGIVGNIESFSLSPEPKCEADLAQCEADLAECLAGVAPDQDGDGEADTTDACPNTPEGAEVDQAGCSLAQFCAAIDATTRTGNAICKNIDWRNDNPLAASNKGDCKVKKGNPGRADDLCVPRL
jgi:hypothetical protein